MEHWENSYNRHGTECIIQVHLIRKACFVVLAGPESPPGEVIGDQKARNLAGISKFGPQTDQTYDIYEAGKPST